MQKFRREYVTVYNVASQATALAKALELNSSLTSVELWSNQIGDTGATDLARL